MSDKTSITSPQEPFAHLKGPFSPFATALRNIKANLISKHGNISWGNIQDEILKEILTLNILSSSFDLDDSEKVYIEFPVAACWWSKSRNDPKPEARLFYSGEYPNYEAGTMPDEVTRIKTNVWKAVEDIYQTNSVDGVVEFEGQPTDYPESLRHISGFWRIDINQHLVFIILFSLAPEDLSASGEVLTAIKTSFKQQFLEPGCAHYGTLIPESSTDRAAIKKERKLRSSSALTDVPVLEDLVSRIQDEIIRVKPHGVRAAPAQEPSDSEKEEEFKDAFSVVFVRPALNTDGRLCFRYILTYKQVGYLARQSPGEIMDLVQTKKRDVLAGLSNQFAEMIPNFAGEISNVPQLQNAIDKYGTAFENDGKNGGKIEELIRRSISAYYAFRKESISAFESALRQGDVDKTSVTELEHKEAAKTAQLLAAAIESPKNWVLSSQAFLVTQIMRSGRSDVVSDFINHPFSKYIQYRTEDLFRIFRDGFRGEPFYPPVLHLFEMLFFPERFFMYPIYQFEGVPLLLCAFNADYYRESRPVLNAILERHVPAIFNSMLTHQVATTNKLLAETAKEFSGTSIGSNELYFQVLAWRMKHLIRLFCRDMKNVESLVITEAEPAVARNFDRATDIVFIDSNKIGIKIKGQTYVMQLDPSKQVDSSKPPTDFIVSSTDGRNILKVYLEHYLSLFSRTRASFSLAKQEERSELSHVVAHAVKTSLSPLSSLSYVFRGYINDIATLIGRIEKFRKEPDLYFKEANLTVADKIPANQLNSISNVFAFYSEDAERKIGILYGGMRKVRSAKEKDPSKVGNYVLSGLIRGYCIALIRSLDAVVSNTEQGGSLATLNFELNGDKFDFRVPEVEETLEAAGGYKFRRLEKHIVSLMKLAFGTIEAGGCDLISNEIELPIWKCKILTIVTEELTLNALSNWVHGPIRVRSDSQCLFSIENWSSQSIPELHEGIGDRAMGGLDAAYFLTEDRYHLGMRLLTRSEKVEGTEWVCNLVEMRKDDG